MSTPQEIRRFRVGPASSPHRLPKMMVFAIFFPVELEPIGPVANLQVEVKVVLTHLNLYGLSGGANPSTPGGEERWTKRLWYWVKEHVPSLLDILVNDGGVEVRLTDSDLQALANVLPEKVEYDPDRWFDTTARHSMRRQVFISCGQVTEKEIALGREIERIVSSMPGFTGYFAQNQNSPAGVTQHILGALFNSASLICVMHHRGEIRGLDGKMWERASVWIEQEIAIAAFMEQVLTRQIAVRLYCEKGITVEGVRQQIMVHPVYFQEPEEILKDLKQWLPTLRDTMPAEEQTIPLEEEHRLVEQGIREYPSLGSAKKFLDRYPRIPSSAKRRMHKAIVDGHKAKYGMSPKKTTDEDLERLYPEG